MAGHLPAGIRILEQGQDDSSLWARLEVEPDSPCFRGHFEGQPILPGIAQLAMVLGVLGVQGEPRELRAVRSLKLRRLVRPGEVLELRVGRPDAVGLSSFETRAQGEAVASGSLLTGAVGA